MESLQEWANKLLDKHEENWDAAVEEGTKIGLRLFKSDPQWSNGFANELITRGIYDLITNVGSERRSRVFHANLVPTNPKGVSGENDSKRSLEIQGKFFKEILNMWLDKSKVYLRDATRNDLVQEANMHAGNARGNEIKCLFYTKLYVGLPEGKKVEDRYTEDEINEINRAVHKQAGAKWKSKILKPPKEDV